MGALLRKKSEVTFIEGMSSCQSLNGSDHRIVELLVHCWIRAEIYCKA